jgi:hypothetical protein
MMKKKNTLFWIYWITTTPFLLTMLGSGVAYLARIPAVAKGITGLGYPLYFLNLLGTFKVLGAIAIGAGLSRRLKEWAYAGFTFVLISAVYSHFASGQGRAAFAPVPPFLLLVTSYACWKKSEPKLAGDSPQPIPSLAVTN